MSHTFIMATLADNRCTPEFVESMRRAGMDGVRINSAHVDPAAIKQIVATVHAVDPGIKILMDTKGPEIRTTSVDSPIRLDEGSSLEIRSGHENCDSSHIVVAAPFDGSEFHKGDKILIDDGAIELTVASHSGHGSVVARVTRGGTLDSRKTVAIPDVEIPPLPAVSERDRRNIAAAVSAGIDMIAHSFVRTPADVEAVRHEIEGTDITLFAKIECREAVDNLDAILEAADGLLVARGDLGTHVPPHHIPAIQQRILSLCRKAGKPSIVATQILESMTLAPSPTRAELSDIALAVMEGADWLLLCGETARGKYPVECIDIMRKTISHTEKNGLRCKI